jgi:hypothetical protein
MNGSISVSMIAEHDDGSADFVFDLEAEQMQALLRFGIIKALEAGIKEAQEKYTTVVLNIDTKDMDDLNIKVGETD